MCNKKERKRDRRWYLFPVSTLGRCILLFMAGWGGGFFSRRDGAGGGGSEAGRGVFFFPRRDGAVFFFFRGGTGWLFFFDGTGRDGTGRCFFFFRGPGRDGCFWRWQVFGETGQNRYTVPPAVHVKPCIILYTNTAVVTHTYICILQPVASVAQRYLVTL